MKNNKIIEYFQNKNILFTKADCVVIPVNCVGVMGAGLALQFKIDPENKFDVQLYKRYCKTGELKLGVPIILFSQKKDKPDFVIMFPTKNHYYNASKLEDIKTGLQNLTKMLLDEKTYGDLKSIAFPKLGCGLGKLNWEDVKPLLLEFFTNVNIEKMEIYE